MLQKISDGARQAATEYLVEELGKLLEVKKISLVPAGDDRYIELVITIAKIENPGKLQEGARLALGRLKADKDLEVDLQGVRLAIFDAATRSYIGHLNDAGASSTIDPIEHFHFDPSLSRVLFQNPPKKKKEKKKKLEKYDPEWVKAKKLCRLNQEEIRMAKELHMSPRGLMKNIPSPKQQWKLPVKLWIRELYEERHPGKGLKPEPPLRPAPPLSPEEEEMERRRFEAEMYWEDYADRNDLLTPKKKSAAKASPAKFASHPPVRPALSLDESFLEKLFIDCEVTEDDVPF
jgi:hypothetical protein